ncbi:glycosyltransferase [Starkeya koreensis]|uniref:Glycosyltransferase n=1 Tax=Ancylobacter koreensis TaxID=266121 RepID=A0ABT0DKR5_9HYPH|nr:glycosyltransferase [Ancylobacter koreensis]MCK0207789.1 glycosyltransferase [Ancylobacter koreensis]
MRLLIVGMHNSPHLHRWIETIDDGRTTFLVFPVTHVLVPPPEHYRRVGLADIHKDLSAGVWVLDPLQISEGREMEAYADWDFVRCTHRTIRPEWLASPARLQSVLRQFRPDILHTLETQLAGYLCLDTLAGGGERPPWIASCWGSDLEFFRRFEPHQEVLRRFCSQIDLFLPDCARDTANARRFGYRGPSLEPMPATGGADIEQLAGMAMSPPSTRRGIIVKGYHNWAGRGLLALSALALIREHLAGVPIGVLSPSPPVESWAARMRADFALDIEALPYLATPDDAMRRMAQARIVVGVSISDGIPTTVLEAMTVGAFPIQTSSSCVNEWIVDGQTGLLVSPHDTVEIAEAIARALTDDALVDSAAERNLDTVRRRWSREINRQRAWELYRSLAPGLA